MSDPEREKDRWYNRISQHLTGIGLIIGGEIVVVGIITDWTPPTETPNHERVILSAIAVGILAQVLLWIRQLQRDRQISYDKYIASLNERYLTDEEATKFLSGKPINSNAANFLRLTNKVTVGSLRNTDEGSTLDQTITATVFLILLIFILRIWH